MNARGSTVPRWSWALLAAVLMLYLCQSVAAQEIVPLPPSDNATPRASGPGSARSLTLADLEGIAMANNPTLAQVAGTIEQQRGMWEQVGLYPNPMAGYLNAASNDPTQRNNGIFLSQEIVTAKKRQLARDVELQELNRLGWEQQAQRMRVINDLRIRYYEVFGAQSIAIASQQQRSAEEGLNAAERLFQAHSASRSDVLQAHIQRNAAPVTLGDARYRYDAAWHQLVAITGQPSLAPVPVEGRLDGEVRQVSFQQALDELLANSPQVREADIQIELARREFAREQAQPIPNITLQTVATWDRASGATTVSTLVAVPVPVFNRNQGNIYHTWASIRTAVAEAERVRLVLGDLLSETYRRHQAAQYQVERLRHDILPDAKENFDLVTTGQKQGEFTLFQVLFARHTYSQSQLTYVEALTELQKVNVELSGLLLTGGLNPSSLGRRHPDANWRDRPTAGADQPDSREHVQAASAASPAKPASLIQGRQEVRHDGWRHGRLTSRCLQSVLARLGFRERLQFLEFRSAVAVAQDEFSETIERYRIAEASERPVRLAVYPTQPDAIGSQTKQHLAVRLGLKTQEVRRQRRRVQVIVVKHIRIQPTQQAIRMPPAFSTGMENGTRTLEAKSGRRAEARYTRRQTGPTGPKSRRNNGRPALACSPSNWPAARNNSWQTTPP